VNTDDDSWIDGSLADIPDVIPPMSIVTWQDEETHKHYEHFSGFGKDRKFLYFGDIANMPGHAVLMNMRTNKFVVGFHTENFRVPKDEDEWDSLG
jgi:hypothetical protein